MTQKRWLLLLGGGAALGAVQVPVVEHLWRQFGPPAAVCGTSVGAVHTLMLMEERVDELRDIWLEVGGKGPRWFQAPTADLWNGLFSLKPLRKQMEERKAGRHPTLEGWVGMLDYASEKHKMVKLNDLRWKERINATIGSSSQPAFHQKWQFKDRWVGDGGVAHVLPLCPNWKTYDFIHAVSCSPVGRARKRERSQKKVNDGFEQLWVAISLWLNRVANNDVRRLRRWAKQVPVTLHAPPTWESVGDSTKIDEELVELRFATGESIKAGVRL